MKYFQPSPSIFFLVALTISPLGLAAPSDGQYPCSFSWKSLKATDGSVQDFTTPAVSQPYQGPCSAFAIVAAMETMLELEHNFPQAAPNMSEAWIDYRTWGSDNWKLHLETEHIPVPYESCGNFPPGCIDEDNDCRLKNVVQPVTQSGSCFQILPEWNDRFYRMDYAVNSVPPTDMGWYYVGSVDDNLPVADKDDLKGHILNGPVVLKVDGESNIRQLRPYNTQNVSYHSLTLIGWKDVGTCTLWQVKDSWPGMAGFAYTKADPDLVGLLSSGSASAWQLSDISHQRSTGGFISPPGSAWPSYDLASQCVPPAGLSANLSCWDIPNDQGACMTAYGALNDYTVTWQLSGSNGLLSVLNNRCALIPSANFNGTLTATATDGCGRSVTRSCNFSSSGGGGNNPV